MSAGGIARLLFKPIPLPPQVVKVATNPTSLSGNRQRLAGVGVGIPGASGNHALFGGGTEGSITPRNAVDAYNISLQRTIATTLSVSRQELTGVAVGSFALFAGGMETAGQTIVDGYDVSLSRLSVSNLSVPMMYPGSSFVGIYALILEANTVDIYNNTLSKITPSLHSVFSHGAGRSTASFGDIALFTGATNSTTIEAYNSSLVKSNPEPLSLARGGLRATVSGGHILFGGGQPGFGINSTLVEVYDRSLTKQTPVDLSIARGSAETVTFGNNAMFAGGNTLTGTATPLTITARGNVDAFDINLTRTTPAALSVARFGHGAARVGNFALFAGGSVGATNVIGNMRSTVDAYQLI